MRKKFLFLTVLVFCVVIPFSVSNNISDVNFSEEIIFDLNNMSEVEIVLNESVEDSQDKVLIRTSITSIANQIKVMVGNIFNLRAILETENGTPLSEKKIDFYGDEYLGYNLTDEEGVASFELNSSLFSLGHRKFVANFSGDEEFEKSSFEVDVEFVNVSVLDEVVDENEGLSDVVYLSPGDDLASPNQTLVNETEGLIDEVEYFYWNSTVINNYSGNLEEMEIKLKVPKNLKNITEEIDDLKKERTERSFSVQGVSGSRVDDLKNELKNKTNNKYSEVEVKDLGIIKSIKFNDLEFEDEISLGVGDLSEERFIQSYAIDPSNMNFVNATVSVTAAGTRLYKCQDWNFSLQECYGEWILFKDDLVVGEEYTFILTKDDPGFGEEINVTGAEHLDKDRNFISDIFNAVRFLDGVWSEFIYAGEYIRATFEKNMTNGNVVNLFVRNIPRLDTFIEIYEKDGSVVLGSTPVINEAKQYDIILSEMDGDNNVFDIKVVGELGSYLEFDWIHDATRILLDVNLTTGSYFISEGEYVNVTAYYEISDTGGPAGDIRIGLNDTLNDLLDNSCSLGDTFEVSSITQVLCVDCTDNEDGTITLLDPDNGENFQLVWNLHSCPSSSDYSPANLITYEVSTTGNVLFDNYTGLIDISGAPVLDILFPSNGSIYNTRSLFIKTEVTGNSINSCWYNLNEVGNVTYNCSVEPNITAVEGYNNLSVYINNTGGLESSDFVEFSVNSSIPLTISVTSPSNGSTHTDGSPVIGLLGYSTNSASINYSFYIYYENDSLYSVGGSGVIVNGSESDVVLTPQLNLTGNLTTYKIFVNATDGVNNASSSLLYYTLTAPTINLVSPDNDYWDADGNISFGFSVYDETFSNVSCSLLIDGSLNQTNSTTLTGGVLTYFNVSGIVEGYAKTWSVNCTDADNNSGVASRDFHVDKTAPVIYSISDSPDPVGAGGILNITANVSDNFGLDYVLVNISGVSYYMISAGSGIYYYEYNVTGLQGSYNYSVKAYDNVGNFAVNDSGAFEVNVLTINLDDYYGLNSSKGIISGFNTSNLEEIEYFELNFSLNSFNGSVDDWYFNFTANGTNGCSLGNKQSSICYSYPNWIQFINGTDSSNYDGTQGNQGDRIQVIKTGSGDSVNLSIRIDEHYNPNVFKWYDALYNFSDVKWQNDSYRLDAGNKFIRVELNQSLIPLDADQYKLDFRVQHNNPDQPLEAYACNSSFTTGHVHDYAGCSLVASKYSSELQDVGTKFRAIFTRNLIDELGDLKYIVLEHHSENESEYYAIKSYKATASNYTTHWEYSNNSGATWINPGNDYETELNINWFYSGANSTAFVYRLWSNTTGGDQEYLEGNITWQVDPVNNYPPLVDLREPVPNEIISLPYNITFLASSDPNDDLLNVSLHLYQNGVLNKTLVSDMNESNSSYYWDDSTPDGYYNLVLKACELNTSDLFCRNDTHLITINNQAAQIIFNLQNPSDIDVLNLFTTPLNISYNISSVFGLDSSSVKIYYKTNSSFESNLIYTNGSLIDSSGYFEKNATFNISETWYFNPDESGVYPAIYNYDDELMEETSHLTYDLDSKKEYLKIRLFNVSNEKQYSFFEIYADNQTTSSSSLRVYYCNSSYISGDPVSDLNCVNFYDLEASTQFSHSHSLNSKHHVIPMAINSSSGQLGDVYVTNISYFLVRGVTGTNAWNIYYIENVSREDSVQVSANSGSTWSNFSGTVDAHLHQYNGTELFRYYVCANDSLGNQNCSVERTDLLDFAGLPPISPSVFYPLSQEHHGNVTINYTSSYSPNGYDISFYNISLVDENESFVESIVSNNSLDLGYVWDSRSVTDGEYYVRVEVCDDLSQCSYGYSENITINNIISFNATLTDFSGNPINASCVIIYPNGTVFHNGTDVLHEEEVPFGNYTVIVNPMNNIIKEVYIENCTIDSDSNDFLVIGDLENNQNYSELYVIDPSAVSFESAIVTINQTSGNSLYKCVDWNSTNESCNEVCEVIGNDSDCHENWEFVQDLSSGEYNFTINSTDPAFIETSEAVDVALAPIGETSFVVAWVDSVEGDLSFKIMDTNGTNLTNVIDVDTSVDIVSRVSVSMINSTHFVIGYIDGPDDDYTRAIYDINGSQVLAPTDIDTNVGDNTDVSVAQLGDRFVSCYANDQDNDADFQIFDNIGGLLTGETNIDPNMVPSLTLQNLIECSAINESRWVYTWFDDGSNDASFEILDESGGVIVGETDLDGDIGEAGQIATASLDGDRFVVAFYDSTDQDITIAIRNIDGVEVLAPTDIDVTAGTESRVAVSAVRENSSSSLDSFVVTWWDQVAGNISAQVFNSTGNNISGVINVDNQQDATYRLIDVVGRDYVSNLSICDGTFVVAYSNASDQGIFKGFFINGSEWNGICPDLVFPSVTNLRPVAGIFYDDNYTIEIAANVTDDKGVSSVFANISYPNTTLVQLELSLSVGDKYNSSFDIPNVQGRYNVTIIANDTYGNINDTETTYFTLDSLLPNVTIYSPENISYNKTTNIPLNYTAVNSHIEECFYSLNGGSNVSLVNCSNSTINASAGLNSLIVYANDSAGNIGFDEVYFTAFYNTTLDVFDSKDPVEVLEEFTFSANYSYVNGSPVVGASCSIVGELGIFDDGRMIYFDEDYGSEPNESEVIYGGNIRRYDFVDILEGGIKYHPLIKFRKNGNPADNLYVYVRCDGNYSLNDSYLIGNESSEDSPSSGWTFSIIDFYNISSSNCSIFVSSPGSADYNNSYFILKSNLTKANRNNGTFYSNDSGASWYESSFVDVVDFGHIWPGGTVTYNETSKLYESDYVNHLDSIGIHTFNFSCNKTNHVSRNESENITVQDNAAPFVQISRVYPNPTEFGLENVSIEWVASDFTLDYRKINISYPNGSFLTESISSPVDLNISQLNVIGNYTIFAWANDSSGLIGNDSQTLVVQDNVSPQIQFVSPTTVSGNYFQDYIVANVTASDFNLDSVNIYLYNSSGLVNSSLSSGSPLFVNFTNFLDGIYYLNASANDSSGNLNVTETRTIILDSSNPLVDVVYPLNNTFDVSEVVEVTLNITDLSPIDAVIANISSPNGTNYILSDFSNGLKSDNFSINTIGVNWEARNESVATGHVCGQSISGGVLNLSITGTGTSGSTACGLRSLKKLNGDFDVNVSFNITNFETNSFFVFRVTNEEGLVSSGVRVWALIDNAGANNEYVMGFYNGTSFTNNIISTTDTFGKLRIKRENTSGTSAISTYYFNNSDSSWVQVGTTAPLTLSKQSMFAQIYLESTSTGFGEITAEVDEFLVSSDNYTFGLFNETSQGGQYNISLFVNDSLGFINNTETAVFHIVQDNNPPTAPVMVSPTGVVRNITAVSWFQTSDPDGDSIQFNITLLNTDNSFNATIVSNYGNSNTTFYDWNTTQHVDGNYKIRVTVFENETAEKLSDSSLIGPFTVDNTNPSVFNLIPSENSVFNITEVIEISANVTDLNGVDSVFANITFPNLTSQLLVLSNFSSDKYNNSFVVPSLLGVYNVSFIANDTPGNLNDSEITNFSVIDSFSPQIQFVSPTSEAGNYSLNYIVANVTASDIFLDKIVIYLYNSSGLVNSFLSGISPLFVNFTNLSDGVYYLNASANDSSGNLNVTETRMIILDNVAPLINIISPTNITYGNATVLVNISSDGDNIWYNWNGTNVTYTSPVNITFNEDANTLYAYANDSAGNFNSSFIVFSIDTNIPSLVLNFPLNNSIRVSGNVTFNCSAYDDSELSKVELYLNDVINQTNFSGINNSDYIFYIDGLLDDFYNWSCVAYDNVSSNVSYRYLVINSSLIPLDGNYDGNTTDWTLIESIDDVCDGEAILDSSGKSMIQWWDCVDARAADFDSFINLSYNFVDVNFGLDSSFNSSASVTMRGLNWTDAPVILRDGEICNESECVIQSYNNLTGELIFNVSHFSNFTTVGNSQLEIWDQTDEDKNNLTKYQGQQIEFYANYTRKNNDQPITGAICILNFADSSGNSMVYNASLELYEYNRSFSSSGVYDYNVSCDAAGFQEISLSDNVTVSADNVVPIVVLDSPEDYYNSSSALIDFNCSAYDNLNLINVSLYGNWSGGWVINETNSSGLNNSDYLFSKNINDGVYSWNCESCDVAGNCSFASSNRTFTIDTLAPTIDIVSPENISYNNATILLNISSDGDNIWYNWNGTNVSYVSPANVTFDEGLNSLYVYANDSFGNFNFSVVVFSVDSVAPTLEIVSPENISYSNAIILVNISSDSDNVWYNWNGTNVSYISPVNVTFTQGINILYAYANDSAGNFNSSFVIFSVDSVAPTLEIISPENTSYNNATILVNISSDGNNVWYNWNGTNISYTFPANVTFDEGANILYAYANDSVGNENSSFVVFSIDSVAPYITLISPINGSIVSASSVVDFQYNVSDNSEIDNCSLIIDESLESTDVTIAKNITQSFSVSLSNGDYNWSVNCSDSAGNENTSETENFTLNYVAPVSPPVPSGVGGAYVAPVEPECLNDSDCGESQFCSEGECFDYQCDFDYQCTDNKTCWMHRCVKLFDMKIIDVESPIIPGQTFSFDYFIKGVAEIHGDVIIRFWLERDGEVVTEGFDTIYMADFEEKNESAELFLPVGIDPGIYNFYTEVGYDSYYAQAFRVIEVESVEEVEIVPITGEVVEQIGEGIRDNLLLILVIFALGILGLIIYWERKRIEKFLAEEKLWFRKYRVSIASAVLLMVMIGILNLLVGMGVIKTHRLSESLVNFWEVILFLLKSYYIYFIGIVLIAGIIFVCIKLKKRFEKLSMEMSEGARDRIKFYHKFCKKICDAVKNGYTRSFEFLSGIVNVFYVAYEKVYVGFLNFVQKSIFNLKRIIVDFKKQRKFILKEKKKEEEIEVIEEAKQERELKTVRKKEEVFRKKRNKIVFGKIKKGIVLARDRFLGIIEKSRQNWNDMLRERRRVRRKKLKKKKEEERFRKLEEIKLEKRKKLEERMLVEAQRKKRLLEIKRRRIAREKLKKKVFGFVRDVKLRFVGFESSVLAWYKSRKREIGQRWVKYKEERRVKRLEAEKRRHRLELIRARKEKEEMLVFKKREKKRIEKESFRLRREREKEAMLRSLKEKEKRRGLKLVSALKSRMKREGETLDDLKRIKLNLEKIEDRERGNRFSNFLDGVKFKAKTVLGYPLNYFYTKRKVNRPIRAVKKRKVSMPIKSIKKKKRIGISKFKRRVKSFFSPRKSKLKEENIHIDLPELKPKVNEEPSVFARALDSREKYKREQAELKKNKEPSPFMRALESRKRYEEEESGGRKFEE